MGVADLDVFLNGMTAAAVEAGAIVLRFFREGCDAVVKHDGSPVTDADRAAEAAIARRLHWSWPNLPVVAEEASADGRGPTDPGSRFFLVDPLDGTKEFVAKLYDFTVNIALVEDGVPVAGVVFAPAYGELFVGSRAGAFKARVDRNDAIGPAVPIAARRAPQRLIALVSRSHYGTDTDDFLQGHELEAVVPVGSSLKFCRIAEGAADMYPKLGRTMEWDTAAGQAVLEAAGGSVRTLDGELLRYGRRGGDGRFDFANPRFVARGLPDSDAFEGA